MKKERCNMKKEENTSKNKKIYKHMSVFYYLRAMSHKQLYSTYLKYGYRIDNVFLDYIDYVAHSDRNSTDDFSLNEKWKGIDTSKPIYVSDGQKTVRQATEVDLQFYSSFDWMFYAFKQYIIKNGLWDELVAEAENTYANDSNYYGLCYRLLFAELSKKDTKYLREYLRDGLESNSPISKYLPIFKNYDDFHERYRMSIFKCDRDMYEEGYEEVFITDRDVLYYLAKNNRLDAPFLWVGQSSSGLGGVGIYDVDNIDEDVRLHFASLITEAKVILIRDEHKSLLLNYYSKLTIAERRDFLLESGYPLDKVFTQYTRCFNNVEELENSEYYDELLFKKSGVDSLSSDGVLVTLDGDLRTVRGYISCNLVNLAREAIEGLCNKDAIVPTLQKYNLLKN